METPAPWNLLGLRLSGDIGDVTIYTDRYYKKIVYPFSPPDKPPSEEQVRQRARFRQAVQAWRALSDDDRANLEEACRRASLVMGGCALYVSAALTDRGQSVLAIGRQVGLVLPAVPYIA